MDGGRKCTRGCTPVLQCGEILESFYDENDVPMDCDLNGNIYKLNCNADNMTRSKVLYHPSILRSKREAITKANDSMNDDQDQILIKAEKSLLLNKECERKLVQLIDTEGEYNGTTMAESISLEILQKCTKNC